MPLEAAGASTAGTSEPASEPARAWLQGGGRRGETSVSSVQGSCLCANIICICGGGGGGGGGGSGGCGGGGGGSSGGGGGGGWLGAAVAVADDAIEPFAEPRPEASWLGAIEPACTCTLLTITCLLLLLHLLLTTGELA